jgi:hypothetical protein
MNIKCAIAAAALVCAGSALATPGATSANHFELSNNKQCSDTLAAQSKFARYLQNRNFHVCDDELGPRNGRGNHIGPVPEPETLALVIAGLLVVCFVARRRRERA